jgi:hypothetical protein
VLRGVDAVVFVADSQRELLRSNRESWENLKENLALQGLTLASVPHVLQYNKRDLADLLSIDDLDNLLNEFNAPFFEAVATTGIGVEETLQGVVRLVARSLRERFRLPTEEGAGFLEEPPPAGADELAVEFEPPREVAPAEAPGFDGPPLELDLGSGAPGPAPEPPAFADAPGDTAPFRFTSEGAVVGARPDLGAPAPPMPPPPPVAPFSEPEPFGIGLRPTGQAVTGKILVEPLETFSVPPAPPPELPDLLDPFEATPSGGDGAGADVFEAAPAPVSAVPEVLIEPPEVASLVDSFTVSARGPEPTADLPAEASRALVQRVIPRALAQVGEVRELELEVPVPALWTGGKRLTLQFRLTLVPEEDAHGK